MALKLDHNIHQPVKVLMLVEVEVTREATVVEGFCQRSKYEDGLVNYKAVVGFK